MKKVNIISNRIKYLHSQGKTEQEIFEDLKDHPYKPPTGYFLKTIIKKYITQ